MHHRSRQALASAEQTGSSTTTAQLNISSRTTLDRSEPSDSALRREYRRLEEAYREGTTRDKNDVECGLKRERWFTVDWNRMSRNNLWAAEEGPECAYFDGTPEEYTNNQEIWPRGRHLHEISVYRQLNDFFFFMWSHTKPYKTVAIISLMSIIKPFQVAVLSWVVQYIQEHPQTTPLWLYFFGFYGYVLENFLYWWYEMWVPLNSQRVQLRCVLLKKRSGLPHDHPMAVKWSAGRFTGLLKDVDDVINGIWLSMLSTIDDLVTMFYLIILCFGSLAMSEERNEDSNAYGSYVAVFLGLGLVTMVMPFFWFWVFDDSMQECESTIRDMQALYMSASNDRLVSGSRCLLLQRASGQGIDDDDAERKRRADNTAVKAYWLYGRATFRAFFHRLAWKTNYGLFTKFLGPFIAYFLLTDEGFGVTFEPASILIVLLSLKEIEKLSSKLLDYLMKMSRGCNVLRDVAELLNAKIGDDSLLDLETGNVSLIYRENSDEKAPLNLAQANGNESIVDPEKGSPRIISAPPGEQSPTIQTDNGNDM